MPIEDSGITVTGVMREPRSPHDLLKPIARKLGNLKARISGDMLKPDSLSGNLTNLNDIQSYAAWHLKPEITTVLDAQPTDLYKMDEMIRSNLNLEFAQSDELSPQLQNISRELGQAFRDSPEDFHMAVQIAETYMNALVRQRLFQQATPDMGPMDHYSDTQRDYLQQSEDANRRLGNIMLEGIQHDNWTYDGIKPQQVRNFMSTFRLSIASVNRELGLKPDPKHETLGLNNLLSDKYGVDAEIIFGIAYEPHQSYLPYLLGGMSRNRRKEEGKASKEKVKYLPFKESPRTDDVELRIADERITAPEANLEY